MVATRVSVIALLAALPFSPVSAEITLDGTMGPAGPLVGPDFTIADTVGTTQGTNLFHSFSVFNIDSTESATFTGPAGLENVISRVTGGTPSSIDGLFRSTVPGADVYFINPAGVVFGQNASLDVPAAFHTSTADELRFTDTNVFSASNPAATVLTAAPPAAFGFLGTNPGTITVNDSTLQTQPGERLALIGGDIVVDGTSSGLVVDPINIGTAGGRIDLISISSPGAVPLDAPADGFAQYGSILIKNSHIDSSADSSGKIYIRGGEITIDTASIISDNVDGDGGDITVKGDTIVARRDDFLFSSSDSVAPKMRARTSGAGDGGDIRFEAQSAIFPQGYRVDTTTAGTGSGGDLVITAETVEVRDTTKISTGTLDNVSSPGGDLIVNATRLAVIDGVGDINGVDTDTRLETWSGYGGPDPTAGGLAGDVIVTADSVVISGPEAELSSFAFSNNGSGNLIVNAQSMVVMNDAWTGVGAEGPVAFARDYIVNVGSLEIRSGGTIANFALGRGDGGDVHINADSILLSKDRVGRSGTNILASPSFSADRGSGGDAGDIFITTGSLELSTGTFISSSATNTTGAAGNINIVADTVILDADGAVFPRTKEPVPPGQDCTCRFPFSAAITSSSVFPGDGPAGNITIDSDSLTVRDGAAIETVTGSNNRGGDISILGGAITIEGESRIDTGSVGDGPGGDISIVADSLSLLDQGAVIAESFGTGEAGDIFISLADTFQSSAGLVTTEALSSDGGNITINAINMVDLFNSTVTTSVGSGAGAGGNINIDPQFVIVQNSNIIANAFGGPGGNINIVAGLFLIDPTSVISASSTLGLDGIINVDSPVADVTSGVTELPADELDASTLVQAPCTARATGTSSLTSAGRSGIPAGPDGYLPSPGLALETGAASTAHSTEAPAPSYDVVVGGSALQVAMSDWGCS
jgi:filamentous hemagglutinin family protein